MFKTTANVETIWKAASVWTVWPAYIRALSICWAYASIRFSYALAYVAHTFVYASHTLVYTRLMLISANIHSHLLLLRSYRLPIRQFIGAQMLFISYPYVLQRHTSKISVNTLKSCAFDKLRLISYTTV